MYKEKIIDILSGEEKFVDYTLDQIAETKKWEEEAEKQTIEQKKQEAIRQSALAKLAALGLTEDEIAAL